MPSWSRSASTRQSWASLPTAGSLGAARRQLGHLFPVLPNQPPYWKRRRRLADMIEWFVGVFVARSPGSRDDLLVVRLDPP